MRVAEAHQQPDGQTRYVVEYEREGNGTQRPTFLFPSDKPFEECREEMRAAIEEEQKANERPQEGLLLEHLVGEEI